MKKLIYLTALFTATAALAQSLYTNQIKFTCSKNDPEDLVSEYRLYGFTFGGATNLLHRGFSTNFIQSTNILLFTSNLNVGVGYRFFATAYNGIESAPSPSVFLRIPTNPVIISIELNK